MTVVCTGAMVTGSNLLALVKSSEHPPLIDRLVDDRDEMPLPICPLPVRRHGRALGTLAPLPALIAWYPPQCIRIIRGVTKGLRQGLIDSDDRSHLSRASAETRCGRVAYRHRHWRSSCRPCPAAMTNISPNGQKHTCIRLTPTLPHGSASPPSRYEGR